MLAVAGEQLVPEAGMLADQVVEDLTDGGPLGRDGGLAPGRGSQDGGQTDVDRHRHLQRSAIGREGSTQSRPLLSPL